MILWTIQPQEVYDNLMKTGVFRCDFEQSGMREFKSARSALQWPMAVR